MNKIHFVTFGCDEFFKHSRKRLADEARVSGWFDKIFIYEPNDLLEYKKSFKGRGAGYWWWKSVVQCLALNQIDDGDLLLYLDAGCYINKYGKNIFDEYVDIVNKNEGFLAFNSPPAIEKNYTKRDLFKLLDCDTPYYTDSNQIGSGFVIYKKNNLTIEFLNEFQKISFTSHTLNDYNSYNENYEGFVEHRHDQSVFSLLVKKIYKNKNIALINFDTPLSNESDLIRDCIKNKNVKDITNLKYPFLVTRINDQILFNLK